MNKIKTNILVLIFLLLLQHSIRGQTEDGKPFGLLDSFEIDASILENVTKKTTVQIDISLLQAKLLEATEENIGVGRNIGNETPIIIDLPMPENCTKPFEVRKSSIMDKAFAKRYPLIKSYSLLSTEEETTYGRLTFSHLGIHATILSRNGTIGIFPVQNSKNNTSHEITIGGLHEGDWICGLEEDPKSKMWQDHYARQKQKSFGFTSGNEVRTYRLAAIVTGEFYEDNLDATNGSANDDADVIAVLTSVMDGVQVFFDRDVAVRFNLLTPVLYDDSGTDPFIPDQTGGDSRTIQARTQISANFNINDYDIGHVFHRHASGDGWSSGGVAGLGVVCNDFISNGGPQKARGWSGSFNNQTSGFIGLTAHEIGHQFDASHTFNGTGSSCTSNISSSSSYEIASGVTIMAYVGICSAAQNIPISGTAHEYFHTHSLTQMINYINVSGTCAA
ncbi:MAG: reprolysin-like metallopeptidase, partial [Chitinophagales bacterium]